MSNALPQTADRFVLVTEITDAGERPIYVNLDRVAAMVRTAAQTLLLDGQGKQLTVVELPEVLINPT